MKTKELIEQLKKVDPEGNTDVVVGNISVVGVASQPGYYDGSYEHLNKNEEDDITSAEIKSQSKKITIFITSIEDVLLDDTDLKVYYETERDKKQYEKRIESAREKSLKIKKELAQLTLMEAESNLRLLNYLTYDTNVASQKELFKHKEANKIKDCIKPYGKSNHKNSSLVSKQHIVYLLSENIAARDKLSRYILWILESVLAPEDYNKFSFDNHGIFCKSCWQDWAQYYGYAPCAICYTATINDEPCCKYNELFIKFSRFDPYCTQEKDRIIV